MHTVDCESVDDKSLQKLYQEVHKIVLLEAVIVL